MPKTELAKHARLRLAQRSNVKKSDVVDLLDANRCVNVWVDRATHLAHRLVYIPDGGSYIVAVQDMMSGRVVTFLSLKFLPIGADEKERLKTVSRDLALKKTEPLFVGGLWGLPYRIAGDYQEIVIIVGKFRVRGGDRTDFRLVDLVTADLSRYQGSVLRVLRNVGVRSRIHQEMIGRRQGREYFDGYLVRFEADGYAYPLGGHDLLKVVDKGKKKGRKTDPATLSTAIPEFVSRKSLEVPKGKAGYVVQVVGQDTSGQEICHELGFLDAEDHDQDLAYISKWVLPAKMYHWLMSLEVHLHVRWNRVELFPQEQDADEKIPLVLKDWLNESGYQIEDKDEFSRVELVSALDPRRGGRPPRYAGG